MTQNNDGSSKPAHIGSVFISDEYENGQVILKFENRGKNSESIGIYYEEPGSPYKKTWRKDLHLSCRTSQRVQLPDGLEKWEKLYFQVGEKEQPISNASLASLKKLLDKARRQVKVEPLQPETEPSTVKPERSSEVDKEGTEKSNETSSEKVASIDYQREATQIVRSAQERVVELARTYRDGGPIDLDDIEVPTPSQKVLLFLNSMGRDLSEWITKLEQTREANHNLIDTLKYREKDITDKLKELRGDSPPIPKSLELETDINTDTELNEIREKCEHYITWFEGRLFGYEERGEINNLKKYDQFIPQFIKDRLFNGIARFVPFDQLPERLDKFLQLVGYEVVPIEIGKTKVDARVHDIQGSRQTGDEPGTIVDVILPGLRQTTDGEIIQKPVVIRGE